MHITISGFTCQYDVWLLNGNRMLRLCFSLDRIECAVLSLHGALRALKKVPTAHSACATDAAPANVSCDPAKIAAAW
jgi:hypothetical protein